MSGMSRAPRGSGSDASQLVVDDPHPGQPAPDVAGRAVEAVVVVPLEGGALRLAVLHQLVGVRALAAGSDQQVVARVGVEGRGRCRSTATRLAGGQPARLAVLGGAVMAAVQVDGQLAGLPREPCEAHPRRRRPTGGGSSARESCPRTSTFGLATRQDLRPRPGGSGSSRSAPLRTSGIGSGLEYGRIGGSPRARRMAASVRRPAASARGRRPRPWTAAIGD